MRIWKKRKIETSLLSPSLTQHPILTPLQLRTVGAVAQ